MEEKIKQIEETQQISVATALNFFNWTMKEGSVYVNGMSPFHLFQKFAEQTGLAALSTLTPVSEGEIQKLSEDNAHKSYGAGYNEYDKNVMCYKAGFKEALSRQQSDAVEFGLYLIQGDRFLYKHETKSWRDTHNHADLTGDQVYQLFKQNKQ